MKGRNPEDYLALVTNKQGGRPRTDPERGVRYRHLRTFGFTAAEASAISYNVGRYELTVRRLSKGIDPWL